MQARSLGGGAQARIAAHDIAGDLAILIEHRQWATTDCDQRTQQIAERLLTLRHD